MLDNETDLQIAREIDQDTINLFYVMIGYNIDEDYLSFNINDVMAFEALYHHLNSHKIFNDSEDKEYYIYEYQVQTWETIPVFVPKNGDPLFCEW